MEFLRTKKVTENESESDKILWFCAQQLTLFSQTKHRYKNFFPMWVCTLYYSGPSFYNLLHSSAVIQLPHSDYLRKFTLNCGKHKAGLENSHILYMKKIFASLYEGENLVNVLLDENYV